MALPDPDDQRLRNLTSAQIAAAFPVTPVCAIPASQRSPGQTVYFRADPPGLDRKQIAKLIRIYVFGPQTAGLSIRQKALIAADAILEGEIP